jgi:hypothetical protein
VKVRKFCDDDTIAIRSSYKRRSNSLNTLPELADLLTSHSHLTEQNSRKRHGKLSKKYHTEKLEITENKQNSQEILEPSELSEEPTIKIQSSSSSPVIE